MITFQNEGLIDLRALKTFGVSAKDNPSAIGYFGTGLKYALAILLREGCKVHLYRGKRKYTFAVKPTKIRNDKFQIITMNGEELAFTTALGKDWDLWQAFRELWCNTTDEHGTVAQVKSVGMAGHTTIVVEGEDFEEVYENRGTVILIDEPQLRLDGVEVRFRPSEYLYYRGIRVQKLRQPSVVTYNLTRSISLTEDRTVKYSWDPLNILKNAIVRCTDVRFITKVLTADKETYEHKLDFEDLSHPPGPMFLSAAEELRGKRNINESAMRICREAMRREMEEHHSQELEGVPATQLARAKQFCEDINMSVKSYTLIVVDGLEGTDKWICEDRKIFLTPELFVEGTYSLTTALIRAVLSSDGSMTSVDRLIKRLMTLGEKVNGEPLDGERSVGKQPAGNGDEIPF